MTKLSIPASVVFAINPKTLQVAISNMDIRELLTHYRIEPFAEIKQLYVQALFSNSSFTKIDLFLTYCGEHDPVVRQTMVQELVSRSDLSVADFLEFFSIELGHKRKHQGTITGGLDKVVISEKVLKILSEGIANKTSNNKGIEELCAIMKQEQDYRIREALAKKVAERAHELTNPQIINLFSRVESKDVCIALAENLVSRFSDLDIELLIEMFLRDIPTEIRQALEKGLIKNEGLCASKALRLFDEESDTEVQVAMAPEIAKRTDIAIADLLLVFFGEGPEVQKAMTEGLKTRSELQEAIIAGNFEIR